MNSTPVPRFRRGANTRTARAAAERYDAGSRCSCPSHSAAVQRLNPANVRRRGRRHWDVPFADVMFSQLTKMVTVMNVFAVFEAGGLPRLRFHPCIQFRLAAKQSGLPLRPAPKPIFALFQNRRP